MTKGTVPEAVQALKGLTLRSVAQAMSMHPESVNQWLKGRRTAGDASRAKLSLLLRTHSARLEELADRLDRGE
jgi:transcriptional regulator with XRE-family HTH domain